MKLKSLIISLLLVLSIACPSFAETFSDIIVTSPNGIWTDSRAYATLNDAIAAVGANERTVVISSPHTVTTLTVPANVNLKFERDGAINNTGQLTISTKNIQAPNRQIFTGTGDIDFAQGSIVKSAWFASFVDAIDLTNDDEVTLVVSNPAYITANCTVGNNVNLKWESARNRLTANAGVTISNINQVEGGNYQLFAGAGNFRFRDGTILNLHWFNNLRAAITHASTNKLTLLIQGTHTVDFSDTVPSTLSIKMNQGGVFAISTGITLTINSSFEAGLYQVFSCTGTGKVSFGNKIDALHAAWWGFDTTSSGAVNAAAIQAAIDVFPATNGGKIKLHRGSFTVSPDIITLLNKKNITIEGVSSGYGYEGAYPGTVLVFTAGTTGINIYDSTGVGSATVYNRISNLQINGNGVLATGIKVNSVNVLEDISVQGCTTYGIWLANYTNSTRINRVSSSYNTSAYGLFVNGSGTTTFTVSNSVFRANKIGIRLEAGIGASFRDLVVESNYDEGLYIISDTASIAFNSFTNVWIEANSRDDATGYNVIMTDDAPAPAAGAKWTRFTNCFINAHGTRKHINIISAYKTEFHNCDMLSGDTTDGLLIGANATNTIFYGGQILTPSGGTYGNRGGYINSYSAAEGGLTTNMPINGVPTIGNVHIAGTPYTTGLGWKTTIAAAGTYDLELPFTKELSGILSISNTHISVGYVYSTQKIYALMVNEAGTNVTLTQLGTQDGTAGSCTFTVTVPSAGKIRITDTSTHGIDVLISATYVGAIW